MNSRRAFLAAGAWGSIPVLSAFAGCEAIKSDYTTHTEQVSTVLISEDGAKLVFLGEWHYVFDAPRSLVTVLRSPYHSKLTAEIGRVDVNAKRDAVVKYRISLAKPEPQDRVLAITDGFKPVSGDALWLDGELRGKCYDANGVRPPAQSVALNRSYRVGVRRETKSFDAKGLLSPVREVRDGVLMIASIPLLIVIVPIVAISLSRNSNWN